MNQDYTPMRVVSWKKGVEHLFDDNFFVVEYYHDDFIKTAGNKEYPIPAVVGHKRYVKVNKSRVKYSKTNIFIRDNFTCLYCGFRDITGKSLSLDHIIPRSRWNKLGYGSNPSTWANSATACKQCNINIKGDKLLSECGLKLKRQPFEPNTRQVVRGIRPFMKIEKEWIVYLPEIYSKMREEIE